MKIKAVGYPIYVDMGNDEGAMYNVYLDDELIYTGQAVERSIDIAPLLREYLNSERIIIDRPQTDGLEGATAQLSAGAAVYDTAILEDGSVRIRVFLEGDYPLYPVNNLWKDTQQMDLTDTALWAMDQGSQWIEGDTDINGYKEVYLDTYSPGDELHKLFYQPDAQAELVPGQPYTFSCDLWNTAETSDFAMVVGISPDMRNVCDFKGFLDGFEMTEDFGYGLFVGTNDGVHKVRVHFTLREGYTGKDFKEILIMGALEKITTHIRKPVLELGDSVTEWDTQTAAIAANDYNNECRTDFDGSPYVTSRFIGDGADPRQIFFSGQSRMKTK